MEVTERKTKGYRPTVLNGATWPNLLDGKPVFTYQQAERMRRDPQIDFGLRILRAPLYQVSFSTECQYENVGAFIDFEMARIWQENIRKFARQFEFGVSIGETTFRNEVTNTFGQIWRYDRLDEVHPRDATPLEINGEFCGFRLRGGRYDDSTKSTADNRTSDDILAPHAFWYAGENAEFGSYWSRPRMANALEPFLESSGRTGAKDSRRLWFKKCAFRGGLIRYPIGETNVGTDANPIIKNNDELAREIVEKFENGGTLAMPNTVDPTTGNYLWVWEPPGTNGEADGILEYPKHLNDEMLMGMGIPPEIVRAAETGSGYSGRSIPAIVFFTSLDEVVMTLLKAIDDCIIRPLVNINFGEGIKYRIIPSSLRSMVKTDESLVVKRMRKQVATTTPESGSLENQNNSVTDQPQAV
jgi:hypothetical protein